MDFSLTDEQKMIQQTVHRFVERELMPLENEVLQSEGKYPTGIEPNLYHTPPTKAKELGFWGINTPEDYGGRPPGAPTTPPETAARGRAPRPLSVCRSAAELRDRGRPQRRAGEL